MVVGNLSMSKVSSFVCGHCQTPQRLGVIFCSNCHLIQPPCKESFFETLGLPVGFTIDACVLDQAYFRCQIQVHPDRFFQKSNREQLYAAQHASVMNRAYTALQSPVLRGVHLLFLAGLPEALDQRHALAPQVLMQVMDLQEALAHDPHAQATIGARREVLQTALGGLFDAGLPADEARLQQALGHVQELQYYEKLWQQSLQQKYQ